jgi:Tfp pilus assembly protein PilP
MRPKPLIVAMLALSVVLLAGCGGGSKEDFQSDMVAARNRTDAALTQIVRAKSIDDLLKRMRIAATEIRAASTDVQESDAPENLADEADGLQEALHGLSDDIVGTVDTFSENQEAISFAAGLSFESWDTVQARLADLRKAGIDVPPLERRQAPKPTP